MRRRIESLPGQESVWDYPRPPRLEWSDRHIRVVAGGIVVAETTQAFRVLETSHAPVYYLPPESVRMDLLEPSTGGSSCEWKGRARYYSLRLPDRVIEHAAWSYPKPSDAFEQIANYLAFYLGKMDACYVDDEQVRARAV